MCVCADNECNIQKGRVPVTRNQRQGDDQRVRLLSDSRKPSQLPDFDLSNDQERSKSDLWMVHDTTRTFFVGTPETGALKRNPAGERQRAISSVRAASEGQLTLPSAASKDAPEPTSSGKESRMLSRSFEYNLHTSVNPRASQKNVCT